MTRVEILGVPIDVVTQGEAVTTLLQWVAMPEGQHHVVTPNPEMIVEARHNESFRNVLQRSDLSLPDGAGILWAAGRLGSALPERVTGTDTVIDLCARPAVQLGSVRVFLLGGASGVAERAGQELKCRNPALQIVGSYAGSPDPSEEHGIVERINAVHPTVLFVAYGAPAQDLWIACNLGRMPSVRVAMGVGGAFDFLAGVQKRAPTFLQSLGLEWLWRLILEPWRFRRIWRAVAVFPYLLWKEGRRRDG